MTRALRQEVIKEMLNRVPMGRLGSAAEVASCVQFLASSDASYITGRNICVDGGFFMGAM